MVLPMMSEVRVTFNRVMCSQSSVVLGLLYPISPSLQLLVEFSSVRSKAISLFDDEQLNALPLYTVAIVPFSRTEHSKVIWCPKQMLSLLDTDISLKLLP